MKYANRLRNFAVSALAIGCLGNYGITEAMDVAEALKKQPTAERKIKCSLRVAIKVEFEGMDKGEFELFDGLKNTPKENEIPFTVEGVNNPRIVMEIDDSCYKYVSDGNIKVIKLADDKTIIEDTKAPQFNVKVTGGSEGIDNGIDTQVDAGKKYELALDKTRDKQSYKIIIKPDAPNSNTVLKEYKLGTLKFSITGE